MYRQFNNQPYGVFYCRLYLTEIDFFNISVSERVTSHTYSFNSTFFCHALTFLFPFLLALGEFEPFLLSSHGLTSCWSECETAAPWNMMPLSNMPSSFLSQPEIFFSSSYHISEPLSLFLPPSFRSHFHSNSLTFPIFPKTGIAASSSGQLLFQCQVKILGESAIVSQRWNKSCVIWRRMTQSPSLRRPLIKRPIRGGGFAACLPTIPFHILSYSILIYAFV